MNNRAETTSVHENVAKASDETKLDLRCSPALLPLEMLEKRFIIFFISIVLFDQNVTDQDMQKSLSKS